MLALTSNMIPPNFCLTSSLLLNPVGLPQLADMQPHSYSHYQTTFAKSSIRSKMREVLNQKDRASSSSRKMQSRTNNSSGKQAITSNSVVCISSHVQSTSPAIRQPQKMSGKKFANSMNSFQNQQAFFCSSPWNEEGDLMKMKMEGLQYVLVPNKILPIREHIKSKKAEATTIKKLQRETKQNENVTLKKQSSESQAKMEGKLQKAERIISKIHIQQQINCEINAQSAIHTVQSQNQGKKHQKQKTMSKLFQPSKSLQISRQAPKSQSSSRKLERQSYKVNVINFMEPKLQMIERKKNSDIFNDIYLRSIHDHNSGKNSDLQKLLQKKYTTSNQKSIFTSNSDSLPSNSRVKGKSISKKHSIQAQVEENDSKKCYHTDCEQFIRARQEENPQTNRKTGASSKNLQRKELLKNYTFRVRKQQISTQSTHQQDFNLAGWQVSPEKQQ